MSDHSEDFEQVRERIADRLFGQMHGQGITSPLLLADAVLDALGLKQVAWLGPYGVVPGGLDNEPSPGWLPVYVLRPTQSGSSTGGEQ